DRDERQRHQREAAVTGEDGRDRERLQAVEVDERAARRGEERDRRRRAREELREVDLRVEERIGEEQLDRPELPLLGEEPHGEERRRHEQHQADVDEEQLEEVLEDVLAEAERHEEDEVGVEVVPREQQEERPDDVEERLREEPVELLREKRPDAPSRDARHSRSRRSTKRSSSVRLRGPSSSSGQPAAMHARASSAVTCSRTRRVSSSLVPCSCARCASSVPSSARSIASRPTPRTPSTRAASAASSPRVRRTSSPARCTWRRSESTRSARTSFPRCRMSTRSQTLATSARMWLERTIVVRPPSVVMSWRSSRTCAGSSPTVGSSSTRTCGRPTSA